MCMVSVAAIKNRFPDASEKAETVSESSWPNQRTGKVAGRKELLTKPTSYQAVMRLLQLPTSSNAVF